MAKKKMHLSAAMVIALPMGREVTVPEIIKQVLKFNVVKETDDQPFPSLHRLKNNISNYLCNAKMRGELDGLGQGRYIRLKMPANVEQTPEPGPRCLHCGKSQPTFKGKYHGACWAQHRAEVALRNSPAVPSGKKKPSAKTQTTRRPQTVVVSTPVPTVTTQPPIISETLAWKDDDELAAIIRAKMVQDRLEARKAHIAAVAIRVAHELNENAAELDQVALGQVLSSGIGAVSIHGPRHQPSATAPNTEDVTAEITEVTKAEDDAAIEAESEVESASA